jgi:nicotinate-nucleotide adenylyltransferase
MRIGIFGGTFNPIHLGHLRAAEEVKECLGLEKVIFVPSHLPPHKELHSRVPGSVRLEMTRLAISSNPGFELCGFEVEQGGSSYSVRTIEHLAGRYQTTPVFILGRDAFNEIMTWYEAKRLFDLAHFAVMSRPGAHAPDLTTVLGGEAGRFEQIPEGFVNERGNRIVFVDVTPLEISSSKVRDLCRKGRSIAYLVPREVEEYVRSERIYG